MIRYVVCAAVIAGLACGNATGPVDIATTPNQTIRMTNGTAAPIYFFAVDPYGVAGVDWAPCTDPVACPAIAPGKSRLIPFSDIAMYSPTSGAAIVYWWHLRPQGRGTFAPDSIRAVRLSLQPVTVGR